MKPYLIAARREVVSSFRLMGIRGEWLPEGGYERFLELYQTGEYGLFFLGEAIIKGHEADISRKKVRGQKMILVIPEQGGDLLSSVRGQIEQGLGMKV
ncbi:MAG TPA: hypothetical protein GXZ74_01900 [Tissierellia bacterium]|nr:hypothetical protein [Tissierellia bacterium]